jgi:hypothetical protein
MRSSRGDTLPPQTRQTGRPPRGTAIAFLMLSSRGTIRDSKARAGARRECDLSVNPRALALAFRAVNAFHVCGIAFAAWALLVSFLGITREDFPGSDGAERLVAGISVLLAAAAIGTGIYTAATEEEEPPEGEAAIARGA